MELNCPICYIDPGSGMVVAGAGSWLLGILLGALGVVSVFFKKIFRFFRKHWYLFILLIAGAIAAVIWVLGSFMAKTKTDFDKKIIVLGFDGLSPAILGPLMEEGKMPNFAQLQNQGSFKNFATVNPPQSPVAWATFATGQNPGRHGIFDFITRAPENYELSLSLSNYENGKPKRVIQSKCFWQYTSEKNIPTIMLNCPDTFPPDAIKGKMLSGMGVPDILGTEGTFTYYTSEVIENPNDVGGKVFSVRKSSMMILNLIGPKQASKGGGNEHLKVPFKAELTGKDRAHIEYQDQKIDLVSGEWSDWCTVTFKIGLFKKIKGIFKILLIETDPEFKLYITPINFDPRAPYFQISSPKDYSRVLAEKIGLYHTAGMPMDTWAMNEKRLLEDPFILQAADILNENVRKLDHELRHFDKGLLFSYYESPDIIQHMFWRYTDPGHPLYEPDAPATYKEMIRAWYQKLDTIVGKVMGIIEEGDVLLVLSDHGFTTFRRAIHINSWLREKGYLVLNDPGASSGNELLLDIDWSKTKAYSIGFGGIYINQRGREGRGIVSPGKETEDLKRSISDELKKWVDTDGQKVIQSVYENEDIFWGDFSDNAPDLYVGCADGYRASWQTALGGSPEGLIENNLKKWSGSHLVDPPIVPGIILANRKITKTDPSLYDIAPTILRVAGYSDNDMKEFNIDGKPLW